MELRPRRPRTALVSHERWLVSYADFVTLLFAFFVVLYASAQVDRQRAIQLSDAIRNGFQRLGISGDRSPATPYAGANGSAYVVTPEGALSQQLKLGDAMPGGGPVPDFTGIRHELEQALATQIDRKEVELHMSSEGLVLSLREIGFFDSGSARLKPGAEKAFARVGGILRAHSCALRIEGHTDNVPIHTPQFASNWELSTARASGLVRSLVDDYGISPTLLSAAGYAEFHPAYENDTSQGRALNRRVDVVILNVRPDAASAQAHSSSAPEPNDTSNPDTFGKLLSHPSFPEGSTGSQP